MKNKNQLVILGIFILTYAFLAILAYMVIPMDEIAPVQYEASMTSSIPAWQLGLANAAIILVVYGLLGLVGIWFAGKLGLPGTFRERAGWKAWILWPLLLGVGAGIVLCLGDWIFIHAGWSQGFPHPSFPFSLIASATAGIGEEILFRSFVMGLWAFLLNALLKRSQATRLALRLANVIAALAFSASHLPGMMLLFGLTTLAQIPVTTLVELFLLNSIVSLIAGERYMRDGLVAAIGVHFWVDIIWHVIWPLVV